VSKQNGDKEKNNIVDFQQIGDMSNAEMEAELAAIEKIGIDGIREEEEKNQITENLTQAQAKKYFDFEARYWKVKDPLCVFDIAKCRPQNVAKLQTFYKNHPRKRKTKKESMFNFWLKTSENNADHIDFRPDLRPYSAYQEKQNGINLDIFNTFSGFITPKKTGKCDLFWNFIKTIICGNNEKYYKWIEQWMARIVQDPTDRQHAYALSLQSGQGCGKNFFFDNFGKLFKSHYLKIEEIEHILQYNSIIQSKVLIYLDECIFTASQKESNRLKDFITNETIIINQKHIAQYEIKNFITLGTGTNNTISAPVELGDRRWVCLKLSEAKKENKSYFEKIYNQLQNENGYARLMYDLKNIKLDYNILNDYPKTDIYYENQAAWSRKNKPIFAFLENEYEKYENNREDTICCEIYQDECIKSSVFSQNYKEFLKKERLRASPSGKTVAPQLSELFGRDVQSIGRTAGSSKTSRIYDITISDIEELISGNIGKEKTREAGGAEESTNIKNSMLEITEKEEDLPF